MTQPPGIHSGISVMVCPSRAEKWQSCYIFRVHMATDRTSQSTGVRHLICCVKEGRWWGNYCPPSVRRKAKCIHYLLGTQWQCCPLNGNAASEHFAHNDCLYIPCHFTCSLTMATGGADRTPNPPPILCASTAIAPDVPALAVDVAMTFWWWRWNASAVSSFPPLSFAVSLCVRRKGYVWKNHNDE